MLPNEATQPPSGPTGQGPIPGCGKLPPSGVPFPVASATPANVIASPSVQLPARPKSVSEFPAVKNAEGEMFEARLAPSGYAIPKTGSVLVRSTHSGSVGIPPGASRGKFFIQPSANASPLSAHQTLSLTESDNPPNQNIRNQLQTAKIAAMNRRQAVGSRRDQVFDDLDKAEDIVLSLLQCAGNASHTLSEMATSAMKRRVGRTSSVEKEGDIEDDEESKKKTGDLFEDLASLVRTNGAGYLTGVKMLHCLLAPHAHLVKSYQNHGGEAAPLLKGEEQRGDLSAKEGIISRRHWDIGSSLEGITSNMYAARVQNRLAMERRDILREMIRLEELDCSSGCNGAREGSGSLANTAVAKKRKHELAS